MWQNTYMGIIYDKWRIVFGSLEMAVHLDEYTLSTTLIGDISLSDKGKMAEGALSQLSIAWRARNISSAAGWAHALFLISPELFKKLKILYFQWDSPFLEGSAVKFSRLYSGVRITFRMGPFFQGYVHLGQISEFNMAQIQGALQSTWQAMILGA